jgi:hypothetical protein
MWIRKCTSITLLLLGLLLTVSSLAGIAAAATSGQVTFRFRVVPSLTLDLQTGPEDQALQVAITSGTPWVLTMDPWDKSVAGPASSVPRRVDYPLHAEGGQPLTTVTPR